MSETLQQTQSPPFAVINGEVLPLEQAQVPVNDRSFLFGDSLYEVVATYQGKPFFTRDHLQRLRATAAGIYFELPWNDAWFEHQIRTGLDQLHLEPGHEAYVRIVVSRGSGDFNIDIDTVETPPFCVSIFKPSPPMNPRYREKGFVLAVPETRRNSPRSLNPAFKTGNYLNNILCLREAKAQGADDALILDLDGDVTELTTSNFFIVKNGEVWTAPLDVGILDGITRRYLIQVAQALGLTVQEKRFTLADVLSADEAFVSSTLKGAMPVWQVNGQVIREGYGEINAAVDQAYWQYVADHLDSY
ncbi:MAG: aminotransferase class IV [Candidatus Sericytochromatia bacterium]|nr:aminotransferase class IV [Candidatus Sericytochromatia bacterium]